MFARARMETIQSYFDGATVGRRGASIRRSAADANVISARTLPRLRTGSRDLIRNNPHARRGIEAIVSNTVGIGIAPQFSRDGERAEDIKALADAHLGTTDCDPEGRQSYAGIQALVLQAVASDGEVLIRRRIRRSMDGLTVPIQYQIIEADYLDTGRDVVMGDGRRIVQGVEFDAIGRRRGYWLFRDHPGGARFVGDSSFVPADQIIHLYRQDRPGQVRGIPWLAPVMLKLADLADYEDAQLVRQKIAACFVGFVHESFDGTTPPGVTENEEGQLIDRFEPGMLERLPPGTDVQFGEPPTVGADYEPYTRDIRRSIAMGLGVSYEALTGDLRNVNFSSGRMGHLEFQRNIGRWRQLMLIPGLCDPMMRWFLEAADLVGTDIEAVTVRHVSPRREMIDPTKEVPAERDAIRSGLKTLTQSIREAGRDPVEHLMELAADIALLDQLGIAVESDARKAVRQGMDAGAATESPEDIIEAIAQRMNGR